jgi:hypothetical protein
MSVQGIRDINRNVRGQIVSYPIQQQGEQYGNIYFVDKDDGSKTKVARYQQSDVTNNLDIEIKELSFPERGIVPNQSVQQRARMGARLGSMYLSGPFTEIQGQQGIPWPPIAQLDDGTRVPNGYGFPPDAFPTQVNDFIGTSTGQTTGGNSSGGGGTSGGGVVTDDPFSAGSPAGAGSGNQTTYNPNNPYYNGMFGGGGYLDS